MLARTARAAFERFPYASVRTILGGAPALILAPHPDDESLGCGGLIAACCDASPALVPEVVIVTDGAASHTGSRAYPPARLSALRQEEARAAVASLGLPGERLHCLGLPDAGAPWDEALLARADATLDLLVERGGLETVVASWGSDPHCDHQGTQAIARRLASRHRLRLLSYPVWGWLLDDGAAVEESALIGWRLDITPFLAAKRRAVAAHRSQHGGVITDAAHGFTLPAALLSVLAREFEVFFTGR